MADEHARAYFHSLQPFDAIAPIHLLGAWTLAVVSHARPHSHVSASLDLRGASATPPVRIIFHVQPPIGAEVEMADCELFRPITERAGAILGRPVGLRVDEITRRQDDHGHREIWDVTAGDPADETAVLGSWDLSDHNRVDALMGLCTECSRPAHPAVLIRYALTPTTKDAYTVARRLSHDMLRHLSDYIGRPLAKPTVEPHHNGNPRAAILGWDDPGDRRSASP
jgi:hypothetical protein